MKLHVKRTGVVEKEIVVNIRNPNATIANVRALVAVMMKIDPQSFRMIHSTAVGLDDDHALLATSGLQEGDTIVLVSKRAREETGGGETVADPAVATSAASTSISSTADRPTIPARAAHHRPPPALHSSKSHDALIASTAQQIHQAATETRATLPHGVGDNAQEDPFLAQQLQRDADNNAVAVALNQLDDGAAAAESEDDEAPSADEDDDDDGIDDAGGAGGEIGEMVSELLSFPNILELREQFLTDPQRILRQIQEHNPRLFQLIAAHNQEFLNLVQDESLLQALQSERDAADEAYLGEEDEEYDEEDEAAIHDMILQALAQDVAESGGHHHHDDDDVNENEITSPPRLGGRSGADGDAAGSSAGGRNATGAGGEQATTTTTGRASSAAASAGRVPEIISPEDESKIEQLMQLGFTKEQCTAAYFKCYRSVERAANMLFDAPPAL